MPPSSSPAELSLVLLGLALLLLVVGGFVQLDDTSGFGSDRWNLPVGYAAAVVAVVAVVVAATDHRARGAMAAALVGLVVLLVALSRLLDGFRFVYGGDEGELAYLMIVVGLVAMALALPLRILAYAATLVVAVSVAFFAGVDHFSATQCSGPNAGGECDLGFIEGLLWAAVAAVVVLGPRQGRPSFAARHAREVERLGGGFHRRQRHLDGVRRGRGRRRCSPAIRKSKGAVAWPRACSSQRKPGVISSGTRATSAPAGGWSDRGGGRP